ncbi:MAG TPA: hypothetical protein VHC96_14355 [Puia sp.]|jgi:hypothetical protein|nr:hypothetical protein [Puia sp.]
MEREQVVQLLEKYWQAETTVEEEKMLAEYFRGADVPLEWESYRDIFSFYAQEAEVKPGKELEERIMERVRPRPRLGAAWWGAAAVIVLGLGLSLYQRDKPTMKDTYSDPQQALAAVQKALLIASKNMNKGLHPLK